MSDLAGGALQGAIRFVLARVLPPNGPIASASDVAAALGLPLAAATTADAELVNAQNDLAAAQTALGGGATLNNAEQAVDHLGSAMGHVAAAVSAVSGNTKTVADLFDKDLTAAISPTGLASQLGLDSPTGLTATMDTITYEVSSSGAVTIFPGPPSLSVASAKLSATLAFGGTPALALAVTLSGVNLSLGGAGFDGLMGALIGSAGQVQVDLILGAETGRGVTLSGATHGPIVLPATASGGPLDLRGMTLDMPTDVPDTIDLGAAIGATLGGAVKFAIDGIGVRLRVDPDKVAGGGSPLSVAFKPPTGVGASLDAGPVKGGGYLDHDASKSSYAGALELNLGVVDLKAFGIIETGHGFSMIVVMTAEPSPPIELSFGFTLNGVGGIVGIQRTIDTDEFRGRLHDHAIDHLLFPADPVAAAPEILRDLGAVFPDKDGGIVIGPLLKLGWGEPISFVTVTLGVVLSVPDPKVVLLGQVRVALPAPELPIVSLKADVYGEFSAERVLILVMLEDSNLGQYPVSGDIGFFIGFGSEPSFAISAGGFYPGYPAPKELAGMKRLTVDLSPPAVFTVRATAYLALTTTSFQLGGGLELTGGIDPVDFHGWLTLDAIVHWAPSFSFDVDLSAGFDMRVDGASFAGVTLSIHLGGPAPWTAHGTATIHLPILPDISLEVGPLTWGDPNNPPPPLAHPLELVHEALSAPAAWRAEPPADAKSIVSLRNDPGDPALLVHPLGEFEARQHAVPLEIVIARVGASPVPTEESRISLGAPTVSQGTGAAQPAATISPVEDQFAMGQFLDLTDEEKLRAPSFESKLAGVNIGSPSGLRFGANAEQSDLHYDTVYPHQSVGPSRDAFLDLSALASTVLATGAAGRSLMRAGTRYRTEREPIVLGDPGDVTIRSVAGLEAQSGVTPEAMTYSEAAETMAAIVSDRPELAGALQLVALGTAT